jgi:hypothetical protein
MFMTALVLATITFLLCFFPTPRTYIARCGRALWVCRVSAISAGLGIVLFARAAPARDLFVEVNAGALYWTMFFALVLAWALCVHYAARKALEQQAWAAGSHRLPLAPNIAKPLQEQFAIIGTWLPRLLGLACFIAVGWGIAGAETTSALMDAASGDFGPYFPVLLAATFGTAVLYLLIVIFRRMYRTSLPVLLKGDPDAIIAEPSPIWFLKFLFSRQQREARAVRYGGVKADGIALLIGTVVIVCFVASLIFPLVFSYLVPRAWFVPVMLGLPVFPLSIVTAFSHRLRFPIVLLLVLVFGYLSAQAPYHNARTMVADTKGTSTRQIKINDALDRWAQSNCPPDGSGGPDCARYPVIVALAGGASRASFLSATVFGDILDATRGNPTFRDFGSQTFAISGVSGGSVGAAMIRSALVDADPDGSAPCKSVDALWYGFPSGGVFSRFFVQHVEWNSWKTCLQSLTAGDFLSPAILGLAFRDPWGGFSGLTKDFGINSDDRAALLERAFEVRYARLLVEPESFVSRIGAMIGSDQELLNRSGLARPLGYAAVAPRWTPLLLLNATSVDTGRRVIASELSPSYRDGNGQERRVFPEAYDLFEELPHADKIDIPLSTAATLSARFPIISPYGGLPSDDPQRPSERAVDGGYFENDGVTTALELALAIKELRPDMKPVVLHVTNDPVERAGDNVSDGGKPARRGPPLATPRVSRWFESLINPVTALFGTRGGHAAQAVEAVRAADGVKYVRFQVFDATPQEAPGAATGCHLQEPAPGSSGTSTSIDEVSMSWWLSSAVQEYLDRQLCHPSNKEAWTKLSNWLKKE